jgi:hypothetical protein
MVQNKYSKISAYYRFHPVILGLIILLPVLIAPAWSKEPKPFEEFHSNLGEVLILPLYYRTKPPTQNQPEKPLNIATVPTNSQTNEGKIDSQNKQPEPAQTKDIEPQELLTDEEITELLFGDLDQWGSEEEVEVEVEVEVEELLLLEPNGWLNFYLAEFGLGYSDNPLYAAYNPKSSRYGEFTLESFFLSQNDPEQKALLYLYGEGKKFADLKEDMSGLLLALADYTFAPSASSLSYGAKVQHTYYDQGMDFSELGSTNRLKITSNKSMISPFINWVDDDGLSAKFELGWGKETLRQFADKNYIRTLSFTFGEEGNEWIDWQAKYDLSNTQYQDRDAKDSTGNIIPGKVKIRKNGASILLSPQKENLWTNGTKLKAGYVKARNSDGTYYDYQRWKFSLGKEIQSEPWESDLSIGYNSTHYSDRLTSKNALFLKDGVNLNLRITRNIDSHWKAFIKWAREEDRSNEPEYSYLSNFWSVGLSWEK